MRTLRALLLRVRGLWEGSAADRELAAELESHLQMQIEDNLRAGMSPDEARRQALARFGSVEAVKESCRERRRLPAIDIVIADIRYGFRMMRRSKGFTLVATLSLAIGIGATAAIFSVINALVLRALPVPRPHEVRVVRNTTQLVSASRFSYSMFERFRVAMPGDTRIAAMSRVARMQTRIHGTGEPFNGLVQLVSREFFPVLEVRPALGRLLAPGDERLAVAVVSHAFWRGRLGAAADVVGTSLKLNGTPVTIVGVAQEGFSGVWLETPVDAWVPIAMQADLRYVGNFSATDSDIDKPWMDQDGIRWLEMILRAGRLDGAEAAAIGGVFRQAQLEAAGHVSDPEERASLLRQHVVLENFDRGFSNVRDRFAAPLFALMAMVSLLLLIACANTANLLLARAAARQREIAVRLSLGASRGRVMQQLLTESVLLAALAGAAGTALAPWASEALVRVSMGVTTGPLPLSVPVDGRVLAFATGVSILTGLLFGLAPAWRTTRITVPVALKGSGTRGVHDGARLTAAKGLVVAQVALSLLLVVAGALFSQSFRNLVRVDLGFDQHHLVSVQFNARGGGYAVDDMPAAYTRLLDRLATVPGVQSASVATCGLVAGCRSNSDGIAIAGYVPQPGEQVALQENRVGARYFSTVGMPLVAGREFDSRDTATSPRVAVVNEAMVRRYFPNRPPLGQRFGYDSPDTEIIGVVRDAYVNTAREAPVPMAYYPILQGTMYATTLDVRVAGDAAAVATAVQKALAQAEPGLPIERVRTVAQQASQSVSQDRLVAGLTSVLGALALGLACLGLYGLMAYAVKQRTAELGIRMALGAAPSGIRWMVFRESLLLVSAGLAVGVPLVYATSRLISTMLFGVNAGDPLTVIGAAFLLAAVAAGAGYLPASRASRVDPLVALRAE